MREKNVFLIIVLFLSCIKLGLPVEPERTEPVW